uniref:Dihydrolipoamide acetyltransferase component of pyruvate dehydrogenase complex n=1 Tax=Albugo laibachii Nc14 TaxID=890382 RepID=F0W7W6_9STRA|nr:dihydrolipoyllysineresidue acetyltransferase component of pyruvate dehydrogenase complex putative [Albugo laibachii Nc14]CCA23694.1 dihydrolipoyllysineresidue acetyltransferase component of pyruvate dehydrogenase complex putative [Albugo laibachii Nc14]|eukprot:CCA23694.1 dihydrolipoyllysineresidue acetyltransferase component of pyruvate dehydrogenase complex putative [Albugo laibachii Nc14]
MSVGTLSRWVKKEGDSMHPGDVICQVETDKAVVDYEMQDEAILAKLLVSEGTADIPVGATLALTAEDEETYQKILASGAMESYKATSNDQKISAQDDSPSKITNERRPLIKFLGKRSLMSDQHEAVEKRQQASQKASDKAEPKGDSRSSEPVRDSDTLSKVASDMQAYTDIPLSNMRKIIAKRLTASKVEVPHHYTSIDCAIDNLNKVRHDLKSIHGIKVSINDFILKAVALSLRDVPEANHFYDVATGSVKANKAVDVSVAVATPSGLITPIVTHVDTLGLAGINKKFMELVIRARENKLKPEEFQGGSFTISNLGGFGIDTFTAVINSPQACIMAIGRGRKELVAPQSPASTNDVSIQPYLATLLNVTLSSDRRVVDDFVAGQFLQCFKRYMEYPELMAL